MKVGDPRFEAFLLYSIEQGVRNGAYSYMQYLLQRIKTVIIPGYPRKPVDIAVYLNAWAITKASEFKSTDIIEVYNTAPHASIIEFGARAANIKPSRAMVQALIEWARRKGLAGKEIKEKATKASAKYGDVKLTNTVAIKALSRIGSGEATKALTKADKAKAKRDKQTAQLEGIAWAIINNMKKKGIFNDTTQGASSAGGLRVMEKAMIGWQKDLDREVSAEISAAIEKFKSM